jgi:hypothetical protein
MQDLKVARGARWLDECKPGWWADVDVGSLDMDGSCSCVLGQVAGDYFGLMSALHGTDDWAIDHGFQLPSPGGLVHFVRLLAGHSAEQDYRLLGEQWAAEIKRRQAHGQPVRESQLARS